MTTSSEHPTSDRSSIPVAPSLGAALEQAHIKAHIPLVDQRTLWITLLCVVIAVISTCVAKVLVLLIAGITHLAFHSTSPAHHSLGAWVIAIPMIGAFVVGLMARFGSKAIRGHGIPEAMEQILLNESRIPYRMTFLKPISAAIAIGTGGPFGAEGPIIATGGALGSLFGQILHTTPGERKILLASGAAAGMTAIFGTPLAAVFLSIELLLFEFRPRSILPVAFATLAAYAARTPFFGSDVLFRLPELTAATPASMVFYVIEGWIIGTLSVLITKSVYWIEDQFERLPVHWMWWPMIGAIAVGIIGWFNPETLGVGYENIERALSGNFLGVAALSFCLLKFLCWSIALGSGTSGGTLAPILTIGGTLGSLIGASFVSLAPWSAVDPKIAALIGMAACFAGASRAFFASTIFAYEITQQPHAMAPLMAGCAAAYLASALMMKHSIMTEKLARRGHHVPAEYLAI